MFSWIKMNHLTSGFVVWLQVLYLYKQLMEYYLEKGSTLKHLSGILTFLGVLLKFAAYSDNTKNKPLYIILNQLFYDSYGFWYFDSYMYISNFLFWIVDWQTYFRYYIFHNLILHLWITSSSYTCYQNLSLKYFCDNSRVSGIFVCGEHHFYCMKKKDCKVKNNFNLFSFDMIYG